MENLAKQTELKAQEIRQVADLLNAAISEFGRIVSAFGKGKTDLILDDMPDDYFAMDGIFSSLLRMREITNINLMTVSELELSAAVRFVFEMSLWFSFLCGPAGNGKRYFAHVALENKKHLEKEIDHLMYEVENLRSADAQLTIQLRELAETAVRTRRPPHGESEIRQVVANCHGAFVKKFSIYGEAVREGDFKGTADHIETVLLPDNRRLLAEVEQRIETLRSSGVQVTSIKTKPLAELAGMTQEYLWLFSHTSRKIHAEPFNCSVSCDHIPRRSMALFRAKAMLDELIAGLPPRSCHQFQPVR